MTPKKKTYDEMVGMLQEHQHVAPEGWDKIVEELDFTRHVSRLQPHQVEKDLWTGIEEALTTEAAHKKPNQQFRLVLLRIAAVGLLLLGVGFWLMQNQKSDFYAYHSEVEYGQELTVDKELQDATFAKGIDYLSENSFLFSEEKLTEYQIQLRDLETAITEIQLMQEQYGVDAAGIKLLAKMERQKATLIKSMINQP